MGWKEYALKITKIEIAKQITQIKKQAFAGMTAVTAVEFEEGSALTLVGQGAFKTCKSLKEIHFGDNLENVRQNAFMDCIALEVLDFGRGSSKGVTFETQVTHYCVSIRTLVMPEKILSVGKNAFNLNHEIQRIYWYGTDIRQWDELMLSKKLDPDYLADSDNEFYLFDEATGTFATEPVRTGQLDAGEGITAYRNSCYPAKALVLSGAGTMKSFASGAEAPWSDSKTTVPVSTVVLMSSLKAISENAFSDCSEITSVYYYGTQQQWEALVAASGANNNAIFSADVIFVQSSQLSDGISYRLERIGDSDNLELVISGTTDMEDVVPEEQPWFHVRHLVTSVVFEEGVTSVGAKAFYRMRNIEKLTIPSTMDMVGTYAFRYATGLKEVTIAEGVENIGFGAFNCCSALEVINLPASLLSVDAEAFEYCVSLKTVNYAGYAYQWSRICVDNNGEGNCWLLDATLHCAQSPDVTAFADVTAGEKAQLLQFLYEREMIQPAYEDRFGVDLLLTDEEVYTALYIWAGSDYRYENAMDWASRNGLIDGSYDLMNGDKLNSLLNRLAAYNGKMETGRLLSGEKVLTRGEGMCYLAMFLQTENGTADRYGQMVAAIKKGYEENKATGNGKFYVISPNLYTPNLGKKAGDCTLIIFPDGQTMLIDAGVGAVTDAENVTRSTSSKMIPFLQDIGLTSLDYFVLSHGHSDHFGGAKDVFDYIKTCGGTVGNYWYGSEENDNKAGALRTYLQKTFGTTTTMMEIEEDGVEHVITQQVGQVRVDIFGPTKKVNQTARDNWSTIPVNDSSVSLKITYGDTVFLSCGDIYTSREAEVVEAYGDWLRADVIKANHHGNYQSSGQPWVDTVQAKVYLAEIDGNGNAMVAERVRKANGDYYVTGQDGMLFVAMDNAGNYEMMVQYDSNLREQQTQQLNLLTFTRTVKNDDGTVTTTVIDLTSAGADVGPVDPMDPPEPTVPATQPTMPSDTVADDAGNSPLWLILVIVVVAVAAAVIVKKRYSHN